MIPLEELRDFTSEEMLFPIRERVVSDANSACSFELCDELLVWIVVQIIND